MTGRSVVLTAAAGACALALFASATAHAATGPVPSLNIVGAQVAGADEESYHLRIAMTASCSPSKFDTAALIVSSDKPNAIANDALECTNQEVTDIVTVKSAKGIYKSGSQVKVTALLRSVEGKVLLTRTRVLSVQAG